MELEHYKKKRQLFNIINIVLVVLTMVVSGLSIFFSWKESADIFASMMGIISCVFGLVALILGVLLPPKEMNVYLSSDTAEKIALANLVLNDQITSPTLTKGGHLYRSWNFVGFLIIGVLMAIINFVGAIMCYEHSIALGLYIVSAIIWFMLIIPCGFWTYYDAGVTEIEETGSPSGEFRKKTLRSMAAGALALFLILGSASVYSYFKTKADYEAVPRVDVEKLNKELNEAQEKINNMNVDDFFIQEEFENVGEALISLKAVHNDSKFYYKLQYTENALNIISWNDQSETIFVDSFDCLEDGRLSRNKSFVSTSITKADVEGKEDGFIE